MRFLRFGLLAALLVAAVAVWAAAPVVGTLTAKGDGSPRFFLTSGTVQITGTGPLCASENAKIVFSQGALKGVAGKLAGEPVLFYNDFHGTATVTGENFKVGMYGKEITITAKGIGYANFIGTGTYAVNNTTDDKGVVNGAWADWKHAAKVVVGVVESTPTK